MKPKSIHYDGVFEKNWLKYLAGLTEKQKEHLRERLAQKGTYRRLQTTNPPQSPVAWTTIAIGCEPAEHGIFDFLTRDPKTYFPQLTMR